MNGWVVAGIIAAASLIFSGTVGLTLVWLYCPRPRRHPPHGSLDDLPADTIRALCDTTWRQQ